MNISDPGEEKNINKLNIKTEDLKKQNKQTAIVNTEMNMSALIKTFPAKYSSPYSDTWLLYEALY